MSQPQRDQRSQLRERVADMLAENDAAGSGPVSRDEYIADADAVLGLVGAEADALAYEVIRLRNIIGDLYVARGGNRWELYTAIKRAFRSSTREHA